MSRNADTMGNTLNQMITSAYGSTKTAISGMMDNKIILVLVVLLIAGIIYWFWSRNNNS